MTIYADNQISMKIARSVVGVEPTTFKTAATDDDKD